MEFLGGLALKNLALWLWKLLHVKGAAKKKKKKKMLIDIY